jgi:two-component system sensor histidine kinase KdpD
VPNDRSAIADIDWRRLLQLGALLAAPTALAALLDRWVSLDSQSMLYLLAVTFVAYRMPWNWSAGFAIAAVTALNFFFVPPRYTLEVENHEYLIALVAMLAVALLISHLAAAARRDAERAQRNEQRSRQLQALALDLAACEPSALLDVGEKALRQVFGEVRLLAIEAGVDAATPSSGDELDALRCCAREAAVLGPGTGRWPGLDAWYVPLRDGRRALGAARLWPAFGPDVERREHAEALCALIGQALVRARLDVHAREARGQAERAQARSTLLAAVSHDLRTPLAVIVGAASALQAQHARMPPAERQRLLGCIEDEARHLAAVADNTLQLVRLAGGGIALQRGWESIEEIVGAVLARIRARDPARRIRSRVPPDLPLVRADPVLLAQALDNLLDNALKYSAGPVELNVARSASGEALCVAVEDRGPGLDPAQLDALCEPFARGANAGTTHGLGLGLAACRAIAAAHGAALTLHRRAGGGACWCLALPLEPAPALDAAAQHGASTATRLPLPEGAVDVLGAPGPR